MALSAPDAALVGRDHRFHPVRIARVERETADTASFVLDVPAELRAAFAYDAGQFCTFRTTIDGRQHLRSYSMSSSPAVDDEMRVTVKRVAGGVFSNWMNDTLAPGHVIDVTCPAGVFCLDPGDRDVAAFAGGSGITPVFSILKTALATTSRRVHLLYANRDRDAAIFAAGLDELARRHPDRLRVTHHFDADGGFLDAGAIRAVAGPLAGAEFYVCGPAPFMDMIEATLSSLDVEPGRIHIERFAPAEQPHVAEPSGAGTPPKTRVTIELGGRTAVADHRPGTTILQTARQAGMSPPFSCEAGNCATCMAKVVEGAATMHVNNALTDDEVAEGWVLTCQGVPATPSVHVVYEYEGS